MSDRGMIEVILQEMLLCDFKRDLIDTPDSKVPQYAVGTSGLSPLSPFAWAEMFCVQIGAGIDAAFVLHERLQRRAFLDPSRIP
jgi:hypothetical protein